MLTNSKTNMINKMPNKVEDCGHHQIDSTEEEAH